MQAISERGAPTEENRTYIKREIDRARMLVAEERGLSDLSVQDYLIWFIDSHGRNLGLMHAAGFVHRFMHPGNVTLDCRILDLDSMQTFEEAYAAQRARAAHFGTEVLNEKSREHFVIMDTRTVNLAHYIKVVCGAYELPFNMNVAERFMRAYTRAQENTPEELRTVQYAQKAQVRS